MSMTARLGFLLSLLLPFSAQAVVVSYNLVPSYDGSYSTAFPDGDKPADPPEWLSTPAPVSVEGVASSYEVADDYDADNPVTLADGGGCTLPTGVTVDDGNKQLDFSTGTSAGTTANCTLTIDDGVNDPIASPAFSIVINASGGGGGGETPDYIVNGAGGDDFTTIQAAADVAACGDLIQVKNGTYNEDIITTRNCGTADRIIIEAFPTHTPNVTGFSTQAGESSIVHAMHTGWTIGEGMTFTGTNDPARDAAPGTPPGMALSVTAADVEWRGDSIGTAPNGIRLATTADNFSMIGGSMQRVGQAELSTGLDSGNGLIVTSGVNGATDIEIDGAFLGEGGHAIWQVEGTRWRILNSICRNDWLNYVYEDAGAERGNRCGTFKNMEDLFVYNFGSLAVRTAIDTVNTQVYKINVTNALIVGNYFVNHTAGGGAMSVLSPSGERGYSNVYLAHNTFYWIDGNAINIENNGGTNHGIVRLTNTLLKDVTRAPGSAKNNHVFRIRPGADNWEDEFFVSCLVSDQNYTVDLDGEVLQLSELEASYPANFSDIAIVDPDFVSTTFPTSEDPATSLAAFAANFTPQATAALGVACPLSLVSGVVSNSTTVNVDDGGWFRPELPIFLCGEAVTVVSRTANTLVVSDAVTCSDNAEIDYGTDAAPDYGASQ